MSSDLSPRVASLLRSALLATSYPSSLVGCVGRSRDLIVNKYTLVAIAVPRQSGYRIDSAVNPKFYAGSNRALARFKCGFRL